MKIQAIRLALAASILAAYSPVFAAQAPAGDDELSLSQRYAETERLAQKSDGLQAFRTGPHISGRDRRLVDPREQEMVRLYEEVVSNGSASWEERGKAAQRHKEISLKLAQDVDFVLFNFARDGNLRAGPLGGKLTSQRAKQMLSRGQAVTVRYFFGGRFSSRPLASIDELMHLNALLRVEYMGAKALGLPAAEVRSLNILSIYNTVDKDREGGLRLTDGLRKGFLRMHRMDPIQTLYELSAGKPVAVLSYRGAQAHQIQSLEELERFAREDLKGVYIEQVIDILINAHIE
ncbi:MAG: hypothetical protein HY554_04625 [Elusimicrobia bacterium]|nr:hypothetical protein [Elusimicrobiota bacterium]